jgi:hypothetical protein
MSGGLRLKMISRMYIFIGPSLAFFLIFFLGKWTSIPDILSLKILGGKALD